MLTLVVLVVACVMRAPDVGSVGLSILYAIRSAPSRASDEPLAVNDVGRPSSLLA
jgi:hypothetical protein